MFRICRIIAGCDRQHIFKGPSPQLGKAVDLHRIGIGNQNELCPFQHQDPDVYKRQHTAVSNYEGLDKDSIILLEQIRTIDKQRLKQYMGKMCIRDRSADSCFNYGQLFIV